MPTWLLSEVPGGHNGFTHPCSCGRITASLHYGCGARGSLMRDDTQQGTHRKGKWAFWWLWLAALGAIVFAFFLGAFNLCNP